jgi:hypothetical protein
MTVVDAKCAEPRVVCVKSVRRAGALTVDRVRIDFPSGEFTRVFVTGRGGTVLSVKGRYRTVDEARVTSLLKTLGPGTPRRGTVTWAASNGVVTEIDMRGQAIQYTDTKAANTKGIAVTAQAFLATGPKLDSIRPATTASLSPKRALADSIARLGDLALQQPMSPQVTNPLRIPVKITLGQLRCYDENDPTSIFHGDDPYLNIVGTHTAPNPKAWFRQRAYSDVESGDVRNVNVTVFDEGDSRRFVTIGDAVGVQVTLFEKDLGTDDEIDHAYWIVDYNFALANQNKTLSFVENLQGDGARYTLSYKIEIGAGQPDPSAYAVTPRYRSVDPKLYVGSYAGSVGDVASEATLSFLASKDPAYPNGVLYGSFNDGATSVTLRTIRLQGDNVELFARYPSGSHGTLFGYLIGDGNDRRLVGTLIRDGVTRGVSFKKK